MSEHSHSLTSTCAVLPPVPPVSAGWRRPQPPAPAACGRVAGLAGQVLAAGPGLTPSGPPGHRQRRSAPPGAVRRSAVRYRPRGMRRRAPAPQIGRAHV